MLQGQIKWTSSERAARASGQGRRRRSGMHTPLSSRSPRPLQPHPALVCVSLILRQAADEQEIFGIESLEPWGKGTAKSSDDGQVSTHHSVYLWIIDPRVWINDPNSWIRIIDPRVWIIDPRVCIIDLNSWINLSLDHWSKLLNHWSKLYLWIIDPRVWINDPREFGSLIQEFGSLIQEFGSLIQEFGSLIQESLDHWSKSLDHWYFYLSFVCFLRLEQQNVDTLRTSASTCAMTSATLGMGDWDGVCFFIWTGEGIVIFSLVLW